MRHCGTQRTETEHAMKALDYEIRTQRLHLRQRAGAKRILRLLFSGAYGTID